MYRTSVGVIAVILSTLLAFAGEHSTQSDPGFTIIVATGQDAHNILDGDVATQPCVEVRDRNGNPISGARVTFLAPRSGPRLSFANRRDALSLATGKDGRASAGDVKPQGTGAFSIEVRVRFNGRSAATQIRQTNFATLAEARASGGGGPVGASLAANGDQFRIEVLQGDDGVNIIDKDSAVKSIVRVVDKNNLPVAGIAITVVVVAISAAEGGFQGGQKTATVVTGPDGTAQVALDRVSGQGPVQLQMHATVRGQSLQTALTQTNYANASAALLAGKVPGSSRPGPTLVPAPVLNATNRTSLSTTSTVNKPAASSASSFQVAADSTNPAPSVCLFGPCGLGPWQSIQGGAPLPGFGWGSAPPTGAMGFAAGPGLAPQGTAVQGAQSAPASSSPSQGPAQAADAKTQGRSIIASFLGATRINFSFGSPWGCGPSPFGFGAPSGLLMGPPSLGLLGPPMGYCGGPFASLRAPSFYVVPGASPAAPASAALPSPSGSTSAPPATKPPSQASARTGAVPRQAAVVPTEQAEEAALRRRLQAARVNMQELRVQHENLAREAALLDQGLRVAQQRNTILLRTIPRVPEQRPQAAFGLGPRAGVKGVPARTNRTAPTRTAAPPRPAPTHVTLPHRIR